MWSFPPSSGGKESACNAGDLGSICGLGRSPGEGMATHSVLAWRILGTEEPSRLQSMGSQELDTTQWLKPPPPHCRIHHVKCQARWSTSWNQAGQEKYQQPQIYRWYHSNGRKWRGTILPPDEGERGEWKAGLKLNIQNNKIMASGPMTSWQIEGEKVEVVGENGEKWTDFIFLSSKITADSDCSHEIKTLAPWKERYDKQIVYSKQKHHFADKGLHSQRCGFYSSRVWMWELNQRIDAFELWCWRRHWRVPWIARRSNQSILKKINLEYSFEGWMLKLQ